MSETSVIAIVPLPAALGGNDEILVLEEGSQLRLPMGALLPGEVSMAGARRVVQQLVKTDVEPLRLIYIIEEYGERLSFGILCNLQVDSDGQPGEQARFVPVTRLDRMLQPSYIFETLREDASSGFYRPVAHIIVERDERGRHATSVAW